MKDLEKFAERSRIPREDVKAFSGGFHRRLARKQRITNRKKIQLNRYAKEHHVVSQILEGMEKAEKHYREMLRLSKLGSLPAREYFAFMLEDMEEMKKEILYAYTYKTSDEILELWMEVKKGERECEQLKNMLRLHRADQNKF
jgi:hypothetical protein